MRLPWVPRHRLEYMERELKYKAINVERLDRLLEEANNNILNANISIDALSQDLRAERERVEQLRREHAGDLQLAHTRYDEFVRDVIEKLMARPPAEPPRAARSSTQQPPPALPSVIESAIEEFAFGNEILMEQLEREAWRRLKAEERPDEIAEKIRRGETPD